MNIFVDQHPHEPVLDIGIDEIRGAERFQPHLDPVHGTADRDRTATADHEGRWRELRLGILIDEAGQTLGDPRAHAR
ncbi:hypothetical protein D3C86_1423470 [compost metagenome]